MTALNIEPLGRHEATQHMASVGLQFNSIGHVSIKDDVTNNFEWIDFKAPRDARELLVFCLSAATWIPRSPWHILHVNPENNFQIIENFQLNRILYGPQIELDTPATQTILIKAGAENSTGSVNLLVADILSTFLLHEGHAEIISASSIRGEYVGAQDGFLYCYSSCDRVCSIRELMKASGLGRSTYPAWVLDLIASYQ